MDAFLIVQRGEDIGRRFDIDTTQLTIGRGSDNDLALNDPMVSRYHAVVKRQGSRFALIDLGSSNPVVVNDQVLEPGMSQQLNHRDVIFVGKTVFSFQSRAAGTGQATRPATRPEMAATQFAGGRDADSPTPPPMTRTTPTPMGHGAEMGLPADNDKTRVVAPERATPPTPPSLFSSPPPAAVRFDDDEAKTAVGTPPPPTFSPPPPPPVGDRMVGTPPSEEDNDLPTQIIPRR